MHNMMDVLPACFSFVLLFDALHFPFITIPYFDESLLGVRAFNLTCTDVVFGASGARWVTNTSVASSTSGGSLLCDANLTAYAYHGVVHADIVVGASNVTFVREGRDSSGHHSRYCFDHNYLVDSCAVNVSIARLYAKPPSRLINMVLEKMRSTANERLQKYVCNVVVPQMQKDMVDALRPLPPPRHTTPLKPVFPLYNSQLVRAAVSVFSAVQGILHSSEEVYSYPWFFYKEQLTVTFASYLPRLHLQRSLVASNSSVTAVKWLQGIVDDVLGKAALPQPFPVYRLPGEVTNVTLDMYIPENYHALSSDGMITVDVTMASCDANACELYLNPGVAIAGMIISPWDNVGLLVSNSLMPRILSVVNRKINATLHSLALSQHRNVSNPNATVRVSFGKPAAVREMPKAWLPVVVGVTAVAGGACAVIRNVRLHGIQPVLSNTTDEPVSAKRLLLEDVFMVVVTTACLTLFAASNTMTGASVQLGNALDTYSFSMWNTVTDLWHAGLFPLSFFVFVFSGLYPYVKLLSLFYFTVVLQRPLSKRLALIDVFGKFSFIDTFALMVMVSGLEIRGVAQVVIHVGFYLFMFATVASIALGNYATTLYRRGTSHRVSEEDFDNSGIPDGGAAGYVQVATQDNIAPPPDPPSAGATTVAPPSSTSRDEATSVHPQQQVSPSSQLCWRDVCVSVLRFAVMLLCCLPAWCCGCLQYTVSGLARVLAPAPKRLSLWQLSMLKQWSRRAEDDKTIVCIFVVALTTILLAPCLFALLPRRCSFLASWCAVDVFVIACIAGLLQLHQFIRFVLGDGMDDVYNAHATLLWPMLPLTAASLFVWYLVAEEVVCLALPRKGRTVLSAPT
jgi:hypothetical protein